MKTNAKVYVIRDEAGRLKVGHSVDPEKRVEQIRQTSRVDDSAR